MWVLNREPELIQPQADKKAKQAADKRLGWGVTNLLHQSMWIFFFNVVRQVFDQHVDHSRVTPNPTAHTNGIADS